MYVHDDFAIDPQHFRKAMGRFATGVTIVTSALDGAPVGMTVNSFTSVSLSPCMLLVCLKLGSLTGQAIRQHGAFGVNLLNRQQESVALGFARPAEDRFAGISYATGRRGIPILKDCAAYFVCEVDGIHAAGDHDIVVGKVLEVAHDALTEPLIFVGGQFGSLLPREQAVG